MSDRVDFSFCRQPYSIEQVGDSVVRFSVGGAFNHVKIVPDSVYTWKFQKTQIKAIGGASGFMKSVHDWVDDGFGIGYVSAICEKALEIKTAKGW